MQALIRRQTTDTCITYQLKTQVIDTDIQWGYQHSPTAQSFDQLTNAFWKYLKKAVVSSESSGFGAQSIIGGIM